MQRVSGRRSSAAPGPGSCVHAVTEKAKLCPGIVNCEANAVLARSTSLTRARHWVGCAAFLACLSAASAEAQSWRPPDRDEPWNNATLKIGPLFVAPTFDLRNVGIDDNVFREDTNPKRDLTATIAVATIFGAHVRAF